MKKAGRRPSATKRKPPLSRRPSRGRGVRAVAAEVREIEALRGELEQLAGEAGLPRWNANPDDARRSVAKLVLTLVEFVRQLLERQAIRRMEAGTLNAREIEDVGQALMKLEEAVRDIGAQFGLAPEDLNLNLGPIGRLR